jgi:hypothetical protein
MSGMALAAACYRLLREDDAPPETAIEASP